MMLKFSFQLDSETSMAIFHNIFTINIKWLVLQCKRTKSRGSAPARLLKTYCASSEESATANIAPTHSALVLKTKPQRIHIFSKDELAEIANFDFRPLPKLPPDLQTDYNELHQDSTKELRKCV